MCSDVTKVHYASNKDDYSYQSVIITSYVEYIAAILDIIC